MFGCRALYQDGWKAVAFHPIQADEPGLDTVEWELYHVAEDPSETRDLAAAEPERLRRHDRAVVAGSGAQPRVAARQPPLRRLRVRSAGHGPRTVDVRVLARHRHGVGGSSRERAVARPRDHRVRRRRRRRRAHLAGLDARRMDVLPPRAHAHVRAQPRGLAPVPRRSRRRTRTGTAHADVPVREDDGARRHRRARRRRRGRRDRRARSG